MNKARLLASQQRESGAWLSALPSAGLGLRLDNNAIRIATGLRLGCALANPHICVCGAQVDATAIHGLSCKRSAGRHSRHSEINSIIQHAMTSSHIPSVREPVGMFRTDGKRPDGITIQPWRRGKCLVWDATVVDTLATSHLMGTSQEAGAAAKKAANLKMEKYAAISNTHHFVPFAVETLGTFSPAARSLLADIALRKFQCTGDLKEGLYLKQRISIAIQRGNAACILGTAPF